MQYTSKLMAAFLQQLLPEQQVPEQNVLIAGSALFKHPAGLEAAVTEIRANATAAFRAA